MVLYTMVTGKMPFDDGDMKVLVAQVKKGVTFSKPKQPISDQCKDLIRKMLTLDFKTRVTVEEIESHPWLTTSITKSAPQMSSSVSLNACNSCHS